MPAVTPLAFSSSRPAGGRGAGVAALIAYCTVSFLYFGLRLLIEPGSQYIGPGADPQIFIWSFAWLPHAILHGENPFITHAIWAPTGVNLTWTTAVPGLALIFWPVTEIFGAADSYNVAAVLMPALAAWTGFILCRHLTRAFWPSLAGGYLFGFSSYMLGQQQGHMHMTSVFLVPLAALVGLRYVQGELDRRGLVVRLGPLFALELLFSTELSLTLLLALSAAFLVALWLVPERRPRLVSLLLPVAGAYALAAVLTAPFVYYAWKGLHIAAFVPPEGYVADLLNYVVPTDLISYGRGPLNSLSTRFPGNTGERGAYLGLPALAIVVLYARASRHTTGGRFLLAFLAVAAFFALGSELHVAGHGIVPLPWTIVDHWPLWDNVLPVRFALYTSLAVGVIIALWTASRPAGALRWLLPTLAVLSLVPNVVGHDWVTTYTTPPFFANGTYRNCLAPGENILPLPVGQDGDAMLWQVETDFRFRMAGGRIATTPPTLFMHPDTIARVSLGYPIPARQAKLLAAYLSAKDVSAVVVDKRRKSRLWSAALDRIAVRQDVGGVLLYRIAGSARKCP